MSRDGSIWVRLVGGRIMCLPAMPQRYSLLQLGQMSVPRLMAEDLTPVIDQAAIGKLGRSSVPILVGHERLQSALLPGLRSRDLPSGETALRANTAINQFLACAGHAYPSQDFRMEGWVHASPTSWWGRVVGYMLRAFESHWREIGLFLAIRVVLLGLPQVPQNFYGVMEWYNPDTRAFFTPVGELGICHHEMRYVFGLDYGEFVYEERVPPLPDLEALS